MKFSYNEYLKYNIIEAIELSKLIGLSLNTDKCKCMTMTFIILYHMLQLC